MPTRSGHTKAIRASRVIGANVLLASGEPFGRVADVVLDKTSDRIMFAIIGRAGALTAVDNFYPVAWADLDYDEKNEGYLLPYGADVFDDEHGVSAIAELIEDDGAGAKRIAHNA